MQSCICKKSLNGLHTFTVIGCARLSENNANGGFRVKTISIFLFIGSNFYYRIDHMGSSNFIGNQFLTVHAVHKTHDRGILSCNLADAVHCTWQRSIFQRYDQQVYPFCFLGCPYFRMINLIIDRAAFFQFLRTLTLCKNSQPDILPPGKPPYHIRPNRTCAKNCNCFYLHCLNLPCIFSLLDRYYYFIII